jgi:hypothetical protein
MVFDWFGAKRDVDELIARRKYGKAIELLQRQVAEGVRDARVRLQLADVLTMENRGVDAIPLLLELADEHAAGGQAAKAIALLKKVERLDPGRRDVDVKLAALIKNKTRPKPSAPWAPAGVDKAGYEPSGSVFTADHFEAPASGPVSDEARVAAARGASWVPSTRADEPEITPLPDVPSAQFAAAGVPSEGSPGGGSEIVESPLFSGFDRDELVAVIRGLRLLSFEPGDLILAEGDPGDSLFVLTTGEVKAFVRDPETGRRVLVRRLADGAFFGEISILSGKPRTATVTAVTHCELLELDRETLDGITQTYPNVRRVLEDFYVARATTQEEVLRRNR